MSRLDTVLRVVYLLFSEGYYSSAHEDNIRYDICWNAMRLGIFLSRQVVFPKPKIYALVALMCFHASRPDARSKGQKRDLEQERKYLTSALSLLQRKVNEN